jgi:SAM-dependent methyltransferase
MTSRGHRNGTGASDDHVAYFGVQYCESNFAYWQRFGGRPDVVSRRVLEIGSGHGALAVDLAEAGADLVVGVDLQPELVTFANQHVREQFPNIAARVRFLVWDVTASDGVLDGAPFDVVVTKDTFEHVADLPTLLAAVSRLVRPGALLYAGFSPLYHSPYGDHGRAGLRMPWGHIVLPWDRVRRAYERRTGHPVHSLSDVGLNGLTPAEYRAAVAASPFVVEQIEYNRGEKKLLAVFSRARRLSILEKYFTVSVYSGAASRLGIREGS